MSNAVAQLSRPKNNEKRFDWQKSMSPKEFNDAKRSIKKAIFEQYKNDKGKVNCIYCNQDLDYEFMTLEHKFPQCFGGSYIKQNLAPCCNKCNHERAIQFDNDGDIINMHLFKHPPLKTVIKQEKLATLVVLRMYALCRNKEMEDIDLHEALQYFYSGLISNPDMMKKIPRIYRTFLDSSDYNPWYKKIYYKIKSWFEKKEIDEEEVKNEKTQHQQSTHV